LDKVNVFLFSQSIIPQLIILKIITMSIKSDKWIKKMADQFEMISPFEPAQIRVGEDNRKLISYGTS